MALSVLEQLRAELASWEAAGLQRTLVLPAGVDFTSNDYLGLSRDERVISAAREAVERWGAGAPAARLLRGTLPVHRSAESAAATWLGTETTLLFPSGWQANQAVITTLAGPPDVIFSDERNHASLIDGCRLSKARCHVFPHNDMKDLEAGLQGAQNARRRLIAVERVYSMDGDLAPLEVLAELCQKYDAWLLLDEAHAAGLLTAKLARNERVLARIVTGGKALGVSGAFVGGRTEVIDLLINRGRSFVFTTAPTPATAAALRCSIELVQAEPERAARAQENAELLRRLLRAAGLEPGGASPIVPLVLGTEERALSVAAAVRKDGFDVRAVRPPTVPAGTARLRMVCHASHPAEQVEALAASVISAVGAGAMPSLPSPPSSGETRQGAERLVVAGTDTEVGKTVISALLVRWLLKAGARPHYLKPIQTGSDCDTTTVRSLANLSPPQAPLPPVHLPLPASVDQAADSAGCRVTVAQVLAGAQAAMAAAPDASWVLECAGGLRVPFNEDEDQCDLLAALDLPVVLVARSALGTLNHTLLSVEAAQRRGLQVRALFLVGPRHASNEKTLRRWLPGLPLHHVPHFESLTTRALDNWLAEQDESGLMR